jgi:hypothetical protein
MDATVLTASIENGQTNIAKYLIGAHLSVAENWAGNELMWAAAHDQPDLMKVGS